jgi:hypothetical protein
MSEEEQQPTVYVNNPHHPSEVRLFYPFTITDAALNTFLTEKSTVMRFRARWRQTSSGSASYTIMTEGKRKLGELVIRAIGEQETFLKADTTGPLPDYLPWILMQFVWWLPTNMLMIKASAYQAPKPPGPPPAPLEQEPKRPTIDEPPARDDPIDDWLDWRERQIARGRRGHAVSYNRLSTMSIYSKSQFTYHAKKRK